jgi:hypothetical protein
MGTYVVTRLSAEWGAQRIERSIARAKPLYMLPKHCARGKRGMIISQKKKETSLD